jgi:proline iminopeptidase
MFVDIKGCKLFFDVYGSKLKILPDRIIEKPTLIVLHGAHGMVDHTLYVKFWSQLGDLAQVILIDQRGCGRSDPADSSQWNLTTWAEDLHLFCQALHIDQPIIAGISMGGHVMCEYVKHYTHEAAGFIFCNTEARVVLEDICALMEKKGGREVGEIARLQFTASTPEIQKAFQAKCVPHYAKNAYSPQEIQRCKQRPEVFTHFTKTEALKFNFLDHLHKITSPSLFMVGEESPLHPPARALEMAAAIRTGLAQVHIFKGAGAPVYNDSPEEALNVVRDFIQKIAEETLAHAR